MVLLSEVERKLLYSAVAVDRPIYFKNTEIIGCAVVLSVNESILTLNSALLRANQSVRYLHIDIVLSMIPPIFYIN